MDAQPETTTPSDGKSMNWSSLILWSFMILILYVLSAGPVAMLMRRQVIAEDNKFVGVIYCPLVWAYMDTPMSKPLGMYLHLWDPSRFDKDGDWKFTGTIVVSPQTNSTAVNPLNFEPQYEITLHHFFVLRAADVARNSGWLMCERSS